MSQTVEGSPRVLKLLDELHTEQQEKYNFWIILYYRLKYALFHFILRRADVTVSSLVDEYGGGRFVALERDKSELVDLLARAQQARVIVEAGTSYGVSTIYLALAVGQNVKSAAGSIARSDLPRKVIATEKEPTKAAEARKHWSLASDEVKPWIELREGDLLETLKENLPEVDMLLLDSMPHSLPLNHSRTLTTPNQFGPHLLCPLLKS